MKEEQCKNWNAIHKGKFQETMGGGHLEMEYHAAVKKKKLQSICTYQHSKISMTHVNSEF